MKIIFSDIEVIEPDKNQVRLTRENQVIHYDYLVIATGSQIRPEETPGLVDGGWRKNVFDFYTVEGAVALARFLKFWGEEKLKQAAASIGPKAGYIPHDVTKLAQAPALMEKVTRQFGAPTILINHAGIHLKKPAVDTTEDEFLKVLTTHLLGAHALTRGGLPGMIKRRGGSVLFIASMASLFGLPSVVAYSAAKSAYLGMVRALATELSPHGLRVNAIAPGWIETGMSRAVMKNDPAREKKILERTPLPWPRSTA